MLAGRRQIKLSEKDWVRTVSPHAPIQCPGLQVSERPHSTHEECLAHITQERLHHCPRVNGHLLHLVVRASERGDRLEHFGRGQPGDDLVHVEIAGEDDEVLQLGWRKVVDLPDVAASRRGLAVAPTGLPSPPTRSCPTTGPSASERVGKSFVLRERAPCNATCRRCAQERQSRHAAVAEGGLTRVEVLLTLRNQSNAVTANHQLRLEATSRATHLVKLVALDADAFDAERHLLVVGASDDQASGPDLTRANIT